MDIVSHDVVDKSISHCLADGLDGESDISITYLSELPISGAEACGEPVWISSC